MSLVDEVVQISPASIEYKVSPIGDLRGFVGGDWDIERRFLLADAVKYRSIEQRYVEGRDWEDTDIFREVYSARFNAGQSVRGAITFSELVGQYYGRVDDMFLDMKRNGFRAGRGPLPTLFMGRNGEIFIGNQGNHRLAMAKVIGLDRIAGRIICKHSRT